ncbi:MAG: Biopolymer transport protein ExbB [Deltaproteobacteria bacterium ADurb.Bin135]|jgi:biopolymer transport protein ExbB|nr:MAG: Biopolymer transport protein ExbB [Deltaproteobacteria bacterium ADurb.Bin135]
MMIPLAICSIVAVTIIINRFLFFRRISVAHRAEEVIGLVRKGRLDEALNIIDESSGNPGNFVLPLMKVMSVGITHRSEPAGAMEAAGIAEISVMRRGLVALDTIITLSPLLGLLGTIIGMIGSFNVIATTGLGQPHAVTGGVAEALIATAAGITVAVVTLIPYNYFVNKVERESDIIEAYSTRLELALNASLKAQEQ